MATTWKRSVSESSIASIAKVPVALLWCQLLRPRISRCGCILLVLGAMGFVTAVTISKSLVAWSSIFSAETVLPKGAIHQADWGPATRYVATASVPAVRPTRPVADHVGAQRAKQAFDRRRSRKVAVAERVRLAAEHEPENIEPTAVKERGVPGGGQDYSVSHRLSGADSRRDDSSDNSPEASSASDSDESTTVSEETETGETQTTTDLSNAPPTRTVDGVPATPESANISDASSTVTEIEANKTSATREKSSQSLTETHVHKRGVTVMSPKLSSVTHSSKQTKPWPRIMIKVDVVLPKKKPTSTSVHISTNATSSAAMTGLKTSSSSHIDASKSPPVKASAKQWLSSSVEPYSIPKINLASSAKVTQRTASYYTTAKTSRLPPIESSGKETLPSGEPSHASSVQATVKITSNYSNTNMSRSTITEMSSERRVVTRETATDTDVTSTHSTNTTGQTTSYHGVVNTSQSHGATASWNGITASAGSSSATGVIPEMKSTGTNKTKAAHPIDMSHEITTTSNNVSWPTETFNVTISDWTATWTKSDEEKHSSTRQHGDILCNTTFCAAEASYLSAIFNSPRDPCDNFYEFTCADWHATSSDLQQYDNADDAVTGFVEEMARTVLDGGRPAELKPLFNIWNACKHTGVVTDSDLRSALASLGLNVSKAASVTASDVLHAAGTLLYKLDNAPILSVELVSNPWNATPKLIALGEPDIFVSRVDVQVEASKKQLSALACKFFNAWAYLGERNDTLCEAVADIAFALAKLSRLDQHVSQQMNLHWVASHAYIRMFIPFLSAMKGAEDYISDDATYVVKNILQVGALRDLLTSKPREVLAYMAFHTTVYLAPFLQGKEDLWGFAMFMLTKTQRPQPVPKWRLCLRLVDRLLPGPLVVAIELVDASTPFFADIMAEVMIEEVRSSFIEEVMAIERLESWTKHMLTVKAQSIRVHTFFMAQYAINVFVNNTMAQIQEEIPWKKESLFEYFLNVSAFMAKDWASPIRHPLIEQRRGLSLFDSDCQFNPHRNVVVVPLAMFNLSMPTSARERMFHIPRIGTRISACLFRATFPDNFYRHTDIIPMEHTSKHVNNTLNCLTPHYKNKGQEISGFEKVEDCTAVIVAYETFQQRLFSKQYLNVDYRLQGLGNVTANQLFFVYYALSMCGRPDLKKAGMTAVLQDRVNVPLMNLPEFASAFNCPADSPMNPRNRCIFWN